MRTPSRWMHVVRGCSAKTRERETLSSTLTRMSGRGTALPGCPAARPLAGAARRAKPRAPAPSGLTDAVQPHPLPMPLNHPLFQATTGTTPLAGSPQYQRRSAPILQTGKSRPRRHGWHQAEASEFESGSSGFQDAGTFPAGQGLRPLQDQMRQTLPSTRASSARGIRGPKARSRSPGPAGEAHPLGQQGDSTLLGGSGPWAGC